MAALKRILVGAPVETQESRPRALSPLRALPIFGASIVSAVVYAPDAVVEALREGGQTQAIPWMASGVVVIMLLLGAAYRNNVREFVDTRGDYGLVSRHLGARGGVLAGSSLLVDYFLTVAVSVAAGVAIVRYMWSSLEGTEILLGLGVIAVMVLTALRGFRQRPRVLAAVWFTFVATVVTVAIVGISQAEASSPNALEDLAPDPSNWAVMIAYAGAIASGAIMVTGMEHLAASAPFHREPRGINAGRTLSIAVLVAAALFWVVAFLAWRGNSQNGESDPLLIQAADKIFDGDSVVWLTALAAGGIVLAAAAAVFRRFTELAAVLAADGFLPRQLQTSDDRAVFTNGVLIVGAAAAVALALSGASLSVLVHVYIVGVFTTVLLSQISMVIHFTRRLKLAVSPRERVRVHLMRALHVCAVLVAASVWTVVLVFNVAAGAWAAVVVIVALVFLMWGIRRHYDKVQTDVSLVDGDKSGTLPSATHGIVLVAQLHRPAMRTIAYARAMRHDSLTAVGVAVDAQAAKDLQRQWAQATVGLRLTILDSPYRNFVGPVLSYIKAVRRASPREAVVVYVPEYVVYRWWERFLHNRSGARLRAKLQQIPGVVVTAVPWHLHSVSGNAHRGR